MRPMDHPKNKDERVQPFLSLFGMRDPLTATEYACRFTCFRKKRLIRRQMRWCGYSQYDTAGGWQTEDERLSAVQFVLQSESFLPLHTGSCMVDFCGANGKTGDRKRPFSPCGERDWKTEKLEERQRNRKMAERNLKKRLLESKTPQIDGAAERPFSKIER